MESNDRGSMLKARTLRQGANITQKRHINAIAPFPVIQPMQQHMSGDTGQRSLFVLLTTTNQHYPQSAHTNLPIPARMCDST